MADSQFKDGPKEATGHGHAPFSPHFDDIEVNDKYPECKNRKDSYGKSQQRAAMKETPLERAKRYRDIQRAKEQSKRGKGSSGGGRIKGKA